VIAHLSPRHPFALLCCFVSSIAVLGAAQQPLPTVRLNRAIETLSRGQSIFGLISTDRSFENARAIAASDADFVIIDMEHGVLDFERLQAFLLGMTNRAEIARKGNLQPNVTPLVRLPQYGYEPTTFTVKQALDIGVMGIMFSAISNKEQAIQAVSAMRYPKPTKAANEPMGRRGSGPTAAVWLWGVPDYQKRADLWPLDPQGELLSFIQIETLEGVQKIDEILEVPGISAIFIGPSDLGLSLGSRPGAPDLETAIQTVLTAAKARNIPVAITATARDAQQRLRQGFRILTLGGDGMSAGTVEGLRAARAAAR
jgi:4-hydroxy-2-oxoheptanedioate aldolase